MAVAEADDTDPVDGCTAVRDDAMPPTIDANDNCENDVVKSIPAPPPPLPLPPPLPPPAVVDEANAAPAVAAAAVAEAAVAEVAEPAAIAIDADGDRAFRCTEDCSC
jgi:hypothetical protein